MQGMTKRVANMEYPSPETKAKVSGCESLHKQEKKQRKKMQHRYLVKNMVQVPGSEPATSAIN